MLLRPASHGPTGTWLDEIVELGIPIAVFAVLWFWSSRKERKKARKDGADTR